MRHQRPGDRVVVNADDASAGFADGDARRALGVLPRARGRARSLPRPGARASSSPTGRPRPRSGRSRSAPPIPPTSSRRQRSRRQQARPRRRSGVGSSRPKHHPGARSQSARSVAVPVVDDGMAATPTKAAATLAPLSRRQRRPHRRWPERRGRRQRPCDPGRGRAPRAGVRHDRPGRPARRALRRSRAAACAPSRATSGRGDRGRPTSTLQWLPRRGAHEAQRPWCSHRCSR